MFVIAHNQSKSPHSLLSGSYGFSALASCVGTYLSWVDSPLSAMRTPIHEIAQDAGNGAFSHSATRHLSSPSSTPSPISFFATSL